VAKEIADPRRFEYGASCETAPTLDQETSYSTVESVGGEPPLVGVKIPIDHQHALIIDEDHHAALSRSE
jgi:hypothetical protein